MTSRSPKRRSDSPTREPEKVAIARLSEFLRRLPHFATAFDESYLSSLAQAIYEDGLHRFGPGPSSTIRPLREELIQLIELSRRSGQVVREDLDQLTSLMDPDQKPAEPDGVARGQRPPPWHPGIARALECIELRYQENLSVLCLAREAYMSKSHFSHVFKKTTGSGPHEYLRRFRIEKAMGFIRSGKDVTETCHAVGFTSLSGFEDAFLDLVGMKPIEYRISVQP